ncbi:MAG: ABC transporter ATP-binding protein [candidate division WOR-3 bacterium]|uniref:ABC transporter ATP-binding protein n=1 Tax=candidate division WOR-3 bacterium TaxID=2052148 RepID=A0A7C4WA82_UNCW3
MNKIIEAIGIKKIYYDNSYPIEVLKGIDLNIYEKNIYGIFGPSGSGKSTLLHILSGLDYPTEGVVKVFGEDLRKLSAEKLFQLRNEKFGFLFQFHYLLPEFNVLENVMVPLLIRGEKEGVAKRKAKKILEELEILDKIKLYPKDLSGGERQKVGIARALVGEPKVLFLDEPTGNLDLRSSEMMLSIIMEVYQKRDLTIVVVSHNERIKELCNEKYFLKDGYLVKLI